MTTQHASDATGAAFRDAQQRVLDRYQVPAQSRFVDFPSISGRAQMLVTGEGPPLPMIIGGAVPAVSTWLAWEQPGRVRSQVMIACPAFCLDTSAILPWRLVSIPALGKLLLSLQKPSVKGAEQIIRMVGEDPSGLDEIRGVMVAGQLMPHRRRDLVELMRSVMSWTRPRPEVAVTADQLRKITHPARLIWGEQDGFGSPDAGRRAVEHMPDADLHVLPGGHAPWLHRAEQVADATHEFLDTH